jgi:hypothetical protein
MAHDRVELFILVIFRLMVVSPLDLRKESIRMVDRRCGCSSGVEHNLAKVVVEGSNPFARSFLFLMPIFQE